MTLRECKNHLTLVSRAHASSLNEQHVPGEALLTPKKKKKIPRQPNKQRSPKQLFLKKDNFFSDLLKLRTHGREPYEEENIFISLFKVFLLNAFVGTCCHQHHGTR